MKNINPRKKNNITRKHLCTDSAELVEDMLKVYFTGEKFGDSLEHIKEIESKRDFEILTKIATPQTPQLFNKFSRQFKKIFNAEGFNTFIEFDGDNKEQFEQDAREFLDKIVNIRSFMSDVWHKYHDQSPNSVIVLEIEYSDEDKFPQPKPFVFDYLEDIKKIVFERGEICELHIFTHEQTDNGDAIIRVINEEIDGMFIEVGEGKLEPLKRIMEDGSIEDDILFHNLGFCPAMTVGVLELNRRSNAKINHYFHGLLSAPSFQDLCNEHLLTVKHHAFPIFYSFPVSCSSCLGTGKNRVYDHDIDDWSESSCVKCKGKGHQLFQVSDASEGIMIPTPQLVDTNATLPSVPKPADYVRRDTEIIRLQMDLKKSWKDEIEEAVMGAVGILDKTMSATESLIDYQPVLDTFNFYTDIAEQVENKLSRMMLVIRYNMTIMEGEQRIQPFMNITINYGRKYHIKSEQQILSEFQSGKEKGVPNFILEGLLKESIQIRFEQSPEELERALLLLEIEPFPAYTIQELKDEGVVNDEEILKKRYYTEFFDEALKELKSRTIDFTKEQLTERIEQMISDKYLKVDEVVSADLSTEADAKAKLKGTVGGVQGIIAINNAVALGQMSEQSAQELLVQIYGFTPEIADKLIEPTQQQPQQINNQNTQI